MPCNIPGIRFRVDERPLTLHRARAAAGRACACPLQLLVFIGYIVNRFEPHPVIVNGRPSTVWRGYPAISGWWLHVPHRFFLGFLLCEHMRVKGCWFRTCICVYKHPSMASCVCHGGEVEAADLHYSNLQSHISGTSSSGYLRGLRDKAHTLSVYNPMETTRGRGAENFSYAQYSFSTAGECRACNLVLS